MIITKTPFRISFCGGGSDIADFYREYGGCVLSATINRYMYIMIHPYFDNQKTLLKYSQNELISNIQEINHSIFRCVLNDMKISGVEITSTADVPSGTGLGSSSSFTVGLLHTLYCFEGKYVSKKKLAMEACEVEIERLRKPIGKQDQYAAAFGGLNFISFHQNDTVTVEPIITKGDTINELQSNLIMFYTGLTHNADHILAEQKRSLFKRDNVKHLIQMCGLAREMKHMLENNNISDFGYILNESWVRKKELAKDITNPLIDNLYETAMNNGAQGGKLLGAGGGGFLLFYCPREQQKILKNKLQMNPFSFRFEYDGSSVVYVGDKYWNG